MNFSSVSALASASPPPSPSSPPPCHSQINTISQTRVSYSSSSNSLDSRTAEKEEKRDKLLQAETTSGKEGTISSSPSQGSFPESETTRRNEGSNNKLLSVMEIMDEQDMGKHLLGLAIPMGVALVLSASSLVQTTEMNIVPISLSFAVAFICNGLLLRKTFTNMSTFILLLGSSLMMLSFYSLVGLFLPLYLKWIPLLCWLASIIPFAMYGWAYFRRDARQDEKDPEKGE